jgi:hypothetical protein
MPEPEIVFHPILVATGGADVDGRLAMVDDHLVAVFVRLSGEEHTDLWGSWSLEATSKPDLPPPTLFFATLADAAAWIRQNLI